MCNSHRKSHPSATLWAVYSKKRSADTHLVWEEHFTSQHKNVSLARRADDKNLKRYQEPVLRCEPVQIILCSTSNGVACWTDKEALSEVKGPGKAINTARKDEAEHLRPDRLKTLTARIVSFVTIKTMEASGGSRLNIGNVGHHLSHAVWKPRRHPGFSAGSIVRLTRYSHRECQSMWREAHSWYGSSRHKNRPKSLGLRKSCHGLRRSQGVQAVDPVRIRHVE